jgi:hypothetical protein
MTATPGLRSLTIGAAGVTVASGVALAGGLAHRGGVAAVVVAVPLFSLGAMVVAPPVAYLQTARDGAPVPRGLRYATGASAILLAVVGLWLAIVCYRRGTWLGVGVGALVDVLGAWLAGRVLRGRRTASPAGDEDVPRYLVPSIAGCLVTIVMCAYLPAVIARGGDAGPSQASMTSILQNLVTVETRAFADSGHFTRHPDLRLTGGMVDLEIRLTAGGYQARIGHRALDEECVLYVGTVPLEPAVEPGEVACDAPRQGARHYVLMDTGVLAATLLLGIVGLGTALARRA